MASSRRNRGRRTARREPFREPRPRLLVACEGGRSEPDYINGYVAQTRQAAVEVVIADQHGDPKRVVEIAKSESERSAADAKRTGDAFMEFDEVWCVFDRDDHTRFHDACNMAEDNGFELAVSNPCFELWLLLHFRESPGAQDRHHIGRMLREHVPDYDKRVEFDRFHQGLREATLRARRLDEDALRMGEPRRNPTTGVYRLTESIAGTNRS